MRWKKCSLTASRHINDETAIPSYSTKELYYLSLPSKATIFKGKLFKIGSGNADVICCGKILSKEKTKDVVIGDKQAVFEITFCYDDTLKSWHVPSELGVESNEQSKSWLYTKGKFIVWIVESC